MAEFTTWTALLADIRQQLASGRPLVGEMRTPDGGMVKYRTIDELIKLESWVSAKASSESTVSGAPRRVYATPTGDAW